MDLVYVILASLVYGKDDDKFNNALIHVSMLYTDTLLMKTT